MAYFTYLVVLAVMVSSHFCFVASTDFCASSPCGRGTCTSTNTTFNCTCPSGVSGDRCESDLCTVNPCKNRGRCTFQGGQFTCACTPGFNGSLCDTNKGDACGLETPCKNGATCVNNPSNFVCNCITGFNGTFCHLNPGLRVECLTGGTMVATLQLSSFPYMDPAKLHLKNSSCLVTLRTESAAMFYVPVMSCATTSSVTATYITYKNQIEAVVRTNSTITREYNLVLPIHCAYSRSNVHVQSGIIDPKKDELAESKGSQGRFTLSMALYKQSTYLEATKVTSYPYSVDMATRLYFQVQLKSSDTNLVIFVDKCVATPGGKTSSPQYLFLNNGCKIDQTLQYPHVADKPKQQFSIDAFRFTTIQHPNVYVHCYVKVCLANSTSTSCDNGCVNNRRRKRRDFTANEDDEKLVSVGPFNLLNQEKKADQGNSGLSSEVLIPVSSAAAVVGVVAICAICIVAAYRRRRKSSNKQELTQHGEVHLGNHNPVTLMDVTA